MAPAPDIEDLPLYALIDLDRIRHNVTYLRSLLPESCVLMAVVKANAYGHGDVAVSRAAIDAGAGVLGVALPSEAARLRDMGSREKIHLLFEPPVAAATQVVDLDVEVTVYSLPFARALSEASLAAGRKTAVTIEVDTGMRRVGVFPGEALDFARQAGGLEGLEVTGVSTHFPNATSKGDAFTEKEIEEFKRLGNDLMELLGRDLTLHAANSAGVLAFPGSAFDMVRVGIAMYGLAPSVELADENLLPALSLRGRVALVRRVGPGEGISYGHTFALEKESSIATIPAGYADGFSRMLSGKGEVLLGGKRRRVAGTVCMDLSMVDVGDDPVEAGDEFVIIGEQGGEVVTADEIAGRLGTINYEIVCMIGARVPRVYTR